MYATGTLYILHEAYICTVMDHFTYSYFLEGKMLHLLIRAGMCPPGYWNFQRGADTVRPHRPHHSPSPNEGL